MTDNVVWAGAADTADQVVPIISVSNHAQDVPARPFSGEYTVTSEVVAAENLDTDVPEQYAVRIAALEREGDTDIPGDVDEAGDEIAGSARSEIESYGGEDGRNLSVTPDDQLGDPSESVPSASNGINGSNSSDGTDGLTSPNSSSNGTVGTASPAIPAGGGGSSGGSVADGSLHWTVVLVALVLTAAVARRRT